MDELQVKDLDSLSQEDVSIRHLVWEIARSLVTDEDSVTVEIVETDGLQTLRVRTDSDGFGRLIGDQGRTVRAIRTILSAASMKLQRTYGLDIQETQIARTLNALHTPLLRRCRLSKEHLTLAR